jgi:DNA-binding NtrC family response regulator
MKKLWIVDDEAPIPEMMREYFELCGFEVETFNDVPSCICKLVLGDHPDILITDFDIDVSTGARLIEGMHGMYFAQKIKYVCMSGDPTNKKRIQELSDEIGEPIAFFDKPAKLHAILDYIKG